MRDLFVRRVHGVDAVTGRVDSTLEATGLMPGSYEAITANGYDVPTCMKGGARLRAPHVRGSASRP